MRVFRRSLTGTYFDGAHLAMTTPTVLSGGGRALGDELAAAASQAREIPHDRRALCILAKTIYRELRQSGLAEEDVMCVAGELLSHVAGEVKDRRAR